MEKFIIHENIWPWGKNTIFVTEKGDGVASLDFDNNNPGVAFLSVISVVPMSRGRGKATALLERCIEYCREQGMFRIDLVSVPQVYVKSFYEGHGFFEVADRGADGTVMTKLLYD